MAPAGTYTTAEIDYDSRGNFFIAWSEYDSVNNIRNRPRARAYDASGTPLGPDFELSDAEASQDVRVERTPDDCFANAWDNWARVYVNVVCLCGALAVIGHMFSIYLGFKGGKGVATSLGVFLFLSPAATGISLAVFIAAVGLTGFVSVGSLLAAGLIPLWLWLLGESTTVILTAAIVAALIWVKHHENIARLLQGREKSWKSGKKKA